VEIMEIISTPGWERELSSPPRLGFIQILNAAGHSTFTAVSH